MIGFNHVNFRKNSATSHAVIEGLHVGKGVPVRYCDSVQAAVVTAGAPQPVLLGDHMHWGCPRRVRVVKNTCFLHGEEFVFGDAVLFRVQPLRAGEYWGGASCVDGMHNLGGAAQQRQTFLEQLLYLWRESGGGGLGTPGADKRSSTCLGEGAARGRMQELLFGGNY
jgi:hypothetical protein